jgi:hypothetical protein
VSWLFLNPHPHCFSATTKFNCFGPKRATIYYLTPCTQYCMGVAAGPGWFLYTALKICFLKKWIVIASSLKITFYEKLPKQNSLLRYFARYFWFLKNIMLSLGRISGFLKDLLIHKQWELGLTLA